MFSSLFSDAWTTHADELEYSNGQCMPNTIVKQAIMKVSNMRNAIVWFKIIDMSPTEVYISVV